MSDNKLPNGWIETKFENLIGQNGVFSDGDWVESKDQDPNGDVRLTQLADIGDMHFIDKSHRFMTSQKADAMKCLYLQKDDLLISRLGDPLGKACLYPANEDKAVTVVDVCVFRPGHSQVDPLLVGYFLNSIVLRQSMNLQASGTTRKRITGKKIKALPFRLPPFNEQKRIVDRVEMLFSDLDKGEELVKQVQKQLATYRQSVLKAAVTGELIGKKTNNWKKYSVGDLITDIRYGTSKKCAPNPSKTPVLRIPNVAGGKIDTADLKHTDFTDAELEKLKLEAGDILIVRSNGSVSLVGLSAIVTEEAVGFAYAGYLIRLRLDHEIILPEFLNLYLHSPIVRNKIELEARSTSGVHNINSTEVKAISLQVPSITEQEEIIDRVEEAFSQINAMEQWCEAGLKRSATLRQSILKDAFSGKLVPQDPADEPAKELLKRIQSVQDNKPAVARGRKTKKARAG